MARKDLVVGGGGVYYVYEYPKSLKYIFDAKVKLTKLFMDFFELIILGKC